MGKDLQEQQTGQAPAGPMPPETLRAHVSINGVMVNTQDGWRQMKPACI